MPHPSPATTAAASAAAPASLIDSRQAAWRLLTTLGLVVLGNSSMYVVSVVLPAVQAEFGVGRADASLPYTLMMVCLGLGGIWTGRMADRHGLMPVLCVGAVAVCGGFVWAGLSGSIWGFGLAHGLMGLIGSSATFAPLMADTALWWNKRRGIAVAICASGNYIAGALWPPIVQHGIELIGWRHTYVLMGVVCGVWCGHAAAGTAHAPARTGGADGCSPCTGRIGARCGSRCDAPTVVARPQPPVWPAPVACAAVAVCGGGGLLRGHGDATGAHRGLLHRPGLWRGARG